MRNGNSVIGLVKEFKDQVKTFIREEIELAKTELLEKISCFSKNAIGVAIRGFVAYAGLIIFLGGLGVLLAFAFERLGWNAAVAEFAGLAIIGLVVMAVGAVL